MQVGGLDDWDDLRAFLAVKQHGSFTEAARSLHVVQTTVSRRVAALERKLGAKLFVRGPGGMQLTDRGVEFARSASAVQAAIVELNRDQFASARAVDKTVSIATTDGLATFWLVPHLQHFHRRYPSVRVEIVTLNTWGELAKKDVDIALRSAPPADGVMVGRKLGQVQFELYGSRAYFNTYGTPKTLEDLRYHTIIENVGMRDHSVLGPWLKMWVPRPSKLAANSSVAVLASVLAGSGLGLLPTALQRWISSESDLRVASDLMPLGIPLNLACDVWILSRPETNKTSCVRSMITFIAEKFTCDQVGLNQ